MEINLSKENHHLVMTLKGRIDSSVAKDFEDAVLKTLDDSTSVILDFQGLDYISSAGLRVILMAAKKLKAANGRLQLCSMNSHIREVFDVSGFTMMLDIKPTLNEALAL